MNNTVVIPPYTQLNFSTLKLCLCDRLQRFILVNLLPLNIVIKDSSFTICKDILVKQVISLPWKICQYGYVIYLILLIKSMRNPNIQLAHLSYLFQVVTDCGLDVFRWSANSQVPLSGLYSSSSLKASWSKTDECPGLSSSC